MTPDRLNELESTPRAQFTNAMRLELTAEVRRLQGLARAEWHDPAERPNGPLGRTVLVHHHSPSGRLISFGWWAGQALGWLVDREYDVGSHDVIAWRYLPDVIAWRPPS